MGSGGVGMRYLLAAAFVASAAALSSCVTAPANPYAFDKAGLAGVVYDLDSRPVAGLVVTFVDLQPPLVAQTDVLGRFLVPDVPRGTHRVQTRASGYEGTEISVDFLARTHVLYLRIASLEQLVSRAVDAAAKGESQRADEILARAETLAPSDHRVQYVRAALEVRAGHKERARRLLEALLADGFRRPAVLLLLADLCERSLDDPASAADYLRQYLRLRLDAAAEERLRAIEGRGAGSQSGG
jgi:hypothetical protein